MKTLTIALAGAAFDTSAPAQKNDAANNTTPINDVAINDVTANWTAAT